MASSGHCCRQQLLAQMAACISSLAHLCGCGWQVCLQGPVCLIAVVASSQPCKWLARTFITVACLRRLCKDWSSLGEKYLENISSVSLHGRYVSEVKVKAGGEWGVMAACNWSNGQPATPVPGLFSPDCPHILPQLPLWWHFSGDLLLICCNMAAIVTQSAPLACKLPQNV